MHMHTWLQLTVNYALFFSAPEVTDVVSGDPLFYAAIYPQPESPLGRLVALCYQIHGDSNTYYNILTTPYTSVNGFWSGITESLNLLTKIGVQANCHSVIVELEGCAVTIDGETFADNFETNLTTDGDFVEKDDSVIVIVLTNGNHPLRLEIECKNRTLSTGEGDIEVFMLQLRVTRARNDIDGTAHGFLGIDTHVH